MQFWINGPSTGGIDDKIKKVLWRSTAFMSAYSQKSDRSIDSTRKTCNKSVSLNKNDFDWLLQSIGVLSFQFSGVQYRDDHPF
jgi:hypothetical protein